MIKDPPILTIRRQFERPGADRVAAFAGVPTGNVVDALGGSGGLARRIKPLEQPAVGIAGVALTCDAGPRDNLALFGALDVAEPGDIVVAATDDFSEAAITGDLLAGMLKNSGVTALVTDGAARDLKGMLAVGLPVYCNGLTPNSPARNGPGTVGLPVTVGGVAISSGDVIVCDADAVVVVPAAQIDEVLERLKVIATAEAALEAKVKAGLKIPDFIRVILDSDRVEEIT